MKKAQSALEFLVTYGWAILAIILVASLLWYSGVFNPTRYATKQSHLDALALLDFKADSGGNLTLTLANAVGHAIALTGNARIGNLTYSLTPYPNASLNLAADARGNYVVVGGAPCLQPGDFFSSENIGIEFTDLRSGLTKLATGFVLGQVEQSNATAPSVPSLLAPANGSSGNHTPLFVWSSLPEACSTSSYQLQVSRSSSFATQIDIDTNTTNTYYSVTSNLPNNKLFYWHVRTFNSLGQQSGWSVTWTYST